MMAAIFIVSDISPWQFELSLQISHTNSTSMSSCNTTEQQHILIIQSHISKIKKTKTQSLWKYNGNFELSAGILLKWNETKHFVSSFLVNKNVNPSSRSGCQLYVRRMGQIKFIKLYYSWMARWIIFKFLIRSFIHTFYFHFIEITFELFWFLWNLRLPEFSRILPKFG